MIICHRCGKENQDMYKFCLGCGAELRQAQAGGEGNVAMMKTMMADVDGDSGHSHTPPSGVHPVAGGGQPLFGGNAAQHQPPQQQQGWGHQPPHVQHQPPQGQQGWGQQPQQPPYSGAPAGQQGGNFGGAPAAAPQSSAKNCPACNAEVPVNFKFCGVCGQRMDDATGPMPNPAAAQASQPAPAPQPRTSPLRITLIRPDGSEGGTHPLQPGDNPIGRDHGAMFENDGYLSPNHAVLTINGMSANIRDLDSLNGVFVRMTEEEELIPGQIVRLGQELLRFDLIEPPAPLEDGTEVMGSPNPGYWGKITVVIGKNVDGPAYPLLGEGVTIGRDRGDINFPTDGYVSGLHAKLSTRDGRVFLTDLGSSNGTFMKVAGERALGHESYVLLGQQLFRLSLA